MPNLCACTTAAVVAPTSTTAAVAIAWKGCWHGGGQNPTRGAQEYLGHADLVTTGRYIKNLPAPRGTTAREKLEAYLAAEIGDVDS
jgi:hypothetical protein